MFHAHEKLLYCDSCDNNTIYGSEELCNLIAPRCSFGYDVLVYIGKRTYLDCRNYKEILDELTEKNLAISKDEIAYLARKFIVYLAHVHHRSQQRFRNYMFENGGYILHLDGTCEGDSPVLISALDGITEMVLENIKLSTEKSDEIIPFLRHIKERFGNPIATVSDMGKGILSAIKDVFPQTIILICHFHFLRDLGKDLLEKEYDIIRKRLRSHGIQGALRKQLKMVHKRVKTENKMYTSIVALFGEADEYVSEDITHITEETIATMLIDWILGGKKEGNGYGFPFDRTYYAFYKRLIMGYNALDKLRYAQVNKGLLGKLWKVIGNVARDRTLKNSTKQLQEKAHVFDKLREAMRITLTNAKNGLNDQGDSDIAVIKQEVEKFTKWLKNNKIYNQYECFVKMIKQIDKYGKKLFSDPMKVKTKSGYITIQPQRTNNISERFFRDIKRKNCKKTGNDSLKRTLKAMNADTPLVKNLENDVYLKLILNGNNTLEQCFAEVDSKMIKYELEKMMKLKQGTTLITKIVKIKNFPLLLTDLVCNSQ